MEEPRVRVVVGEGDTPRRGLLRFVLEGDGYDVVADVTTAAQLARAVADHHPDVVVLDDGIGATAPQVVREISPRTRIVLVWPDAVVPIGGDARVEPSQVLRQLGPTVAQVTAGVAGLTTIERPDWIEKVRKDPATLRERLERGGGLPKRPSVTELQRRGQRLHPAPSTSAEPAHDDEAGTAPVVPLAAAGAVVVAGQDAAAEATIELPESPEAGAPVLRLPTEEGTSPAVATGRADATATEFNRRLGAIALGGAAVVGAVVLALALGGSRVPTDIILAEGPRATIAPDPTIDPGVDEPQPEQEPGRGPEEGPDDVTETPPGVVPGNTTGGSGDGSPGGVEPRPETPETPGGTEPPPEIPGGEEPPPVPPPPPPPPPTAPGRSALSNPHGVPPGQTSDARSASSSVTGPAGSGARHWADGLPGHAGEHGRGLERGKGLEKIRDRLGS